MNRDRVVRNPITGEELIYSKKPPAPPTTTDIYGGLNHHKRQETTHLHSTKPTINSQTIKPQIEVPYSFNIQPVNDENQSSNNNTSLLTNVSSSIPKLNFNDLGNDSNENRMNSASNNKEASKFEGSKFDNILSKNIHNNITDRPKSSYRYGFVDNFSPILAYQNQLTERNSSNSQINAPRSQKSIHLDLKLDKEKSDFPINNTISLYKHERIADLEKLWLQGQTVRQDINKDINNNNKDSLKENLVIETVMTDQLSKFGLSNNNNNDGSITTRTIYTSRGNKFTNLIHPHMAHSLNENLFSKRIKFKCRARSPDGKMALRELFGIFFIQDGSFTIYEFRLMCCSSVSGVGYGNVSKKANALPFVQRKVHTHSFGRRKGDPIDIWNIYLGARFILPTIDHKLIEFEIINLDIKEIESILVLTEEQNSSSLTKDEISQNILNIKDRLLNPLRPIELNDHKILQNAREFIHKQIAARTVEVYMGVSNSLCKKSNEARLVTKQQLHDTFIDYNIQIHSEDLHIVWQVLDIDDNESSGMINYYTLVKAYLGEMTPNRHSIFRELMHKLDGLKTGYIQVNELLKYYRANKHPKVTNGMMTQDEMFKQFIESFETLHPSKVPEYYQLSTSTDLKSLLISYEQFENYYNGLSLSIDNDNDFSKIIKNAWHLQ
jgi:calcyphosin